MSEFRRCVVIAMLAVLVFSTPIWWALDRDPPYEIVRTEIAPEPVIAGEEIRITFHVKVDRSACAPGLIYREFKEVPSGKLHIYDPVMRTKPPEIKDGKFTRLGKLPRNITPGEVIYRGLACYTCNPMQFWLGWPICVHTPDTPFTVRAPQ